MRELLEALVPSGRGMPDEAREAIVRYTKLFWINSGPYNNLTAQKFVLECSPDAFERAVREAALRGARMPSRPGESLDALLARVRPLFFDRSVDPRVTSKTPGEGRDILTASVNNLYDGVTLADLEGIEEAYPLNSRLVKRDGPLVEEVYRVGGRYAPYIERMCRHLEAAMPYATPPCAARSRRSCASTAPAAPMTGARTTSRGSRTVTRPSTRSTASSRSTWMRAAARARGRRWSTTCTRRRRPRWHASRSTRSGSKTGCPGTRGTASRR